MNLFLVSAISGACLLLSFLLWHHPLRQNLTANRWLSVSVFMMGSAFGGSFIILTDTVLSNTILFECLNSLQFLLAPCFYISILYFVNPTKVFNKLDWFHFFPFIVYALAEVFWDYEKGSIATFPFLKITDEVSLNVRDILPFIALFYVIRSYLVIANHKKNLKLISSTINQINLEWLVQFLFILSIIIFIWFNDALFGLPYITEATNFVYLIAIFFLAYFSLKQKAIFAYKESEIKEISELMVFENRRAEINSFSDIVEDKIAVKEESETVKQKRLNADQVSKLWDRLSFLMENDKLYLDNELNLPTVAEKLGIGIHEASFLINESTKDNFYNYINGYRVQEAKRLLVSSKMVELNILGIAFEAGFNSKTTFNTTFKKIVGISPSQYSKEYSKEIRSTV